MTIVAMVLSIILGVSSLVIGYSQAGLTDPVSWFIVLGIAWLVSRWQRWHWFASLAVLPRCFLFDHANCGGSLFRGRMEVLRVPLVIALR